MCFRSVTWRIIQIWSHHTFMDWFANICQQLCHYDQVLLFFSTTSIAATAISTCIYSSENSKTQSCSLFFWLGCFLATLPPIKLSNNCNQPLRCSWRAMYAPTKLRHWRSCPFCRNVAPWHRLITSGSYSGVIKWDPFWGASSIAHLLMVALRDFPKIIAHCLGW